MRNPKWHRDEIILTLDFYFSKDRGSIDSRNPKVIALSKLLNQLPLFPDRPDKETFRNPNGVSLKLSNFLAIDPNHKGKGMNRSSKLDKEVFFEFEKDQDRLRKLAVEIKKIAADKELSEMLSVVEEDEQTIEDSVEEGQLIYRLHKVRERDSKITKRKKELVLKQTGRLACEACGFDFHSFYGEIGKGFIECHHRTPLANFTVATKTTLEDLGLVCSNCHRMLHKSIDTLKIENLKAWISKTKIPIT